MIVVREACVPPTTSHHAKKVSTFGGHPRLHDSKKLIAAKSFWDALFLPHRPDKPLDGPLSLDIELRWPHGSTARKRDLDKDVPMEKGVDCSNMLKTIEDSLGRCAFFVNDSRIVDVRVRKWRSPNPGIIVRLGEAS